MLTAPGSASRAWAVWVIVGVIALQYLLFRSFVLRELAWTYPHNDDQLAYLTQAYGLFDAMRTPRGASELLSMVVGQRAQGSANGVMLPAQASLLFFLFGASRLTAVTLTLAYYALWQLVTFLCVRSISGSVYLAAVSWSLVLAVRSPLLPIGGLTDFRGDSIALSLFGVFVAIVLASNVFLDRRLSLLAGLAAGLLILFRYLSAPYLVGIFGVMVVVCGGLSVRGGNAMARRRVANIILSGIVVTCVAGASLWASRSAINEYYVNPPHDARIWNTVHSTSARIGLYLETFVDAHLGSGFLLAAAVAMATAMAARAYDRRGPSIMRDEPAMAGFSGGLSACFLVACLCVPFCSFFLATAENPVVPGVMSAPAVGLLTLAVGYLMPSTRVGVWSAGWRLAKLGTFAVIVGCAAYGQSAAFSRRVFAADELPSLREVARLHDDIGRYCEGAGLDAPGISTDSVRSYLGFHTRGGVLTPLYYERWGRFLDTRGMVGGSPHKIDPSAVPWLLENTDVLILNDADPSREPRLPVVANLAALRPAMKKLAKTEFVPLGEYVIYGERISVYVRPRVELSGVSGDWMTYDGVVLAMEGRYAKRAREIVLSGPVGLADVPSLRDLEVFASPVGGNGEKLATRLTLNGSRYAIQILLPVDVAETAADRLLVKVWFSRYFVPSEVYPGSPDHRRLVLWKPDHRVVIVR